MKRRQFIKATMVTTAAIASGVSLAEPERLFGPVTVSINGEEVKVVPSSFTFTARDGIDRIPGETDQELKNRIIDKITSSPK